MGRRDESVDDCEKRLGFEKGLREDFEGSQCICKVPVSGVRFSM